MSTTGHSLYDSYYCDLVTSSVLWPILRIYCLPQFETNWYTETCHTKAKKQKLCVWTPTKLKTKKNKKYWDTCRQDRQSTEEQTSSRPFLPDFFFSCCCTFMPIFFCSNHWLKPRATRRWSGLVFTRGQRLVAPSGTRHLSLVLMYSWIKRRADQMLFEKGKPSEQKYRSG